MFSSLEIKFVGHEEIVECKDTFNKINKLSLVETDEVIGNGTVYTLGRNVRYYRICNKTVVSFKSIILVEKDLKSLNKIGVLIHELCHHCAGCLFLNTKIADFLHRLIDKELNWRCWLQKYE